MWNYNSFSFTIEAREELGECLLLLLYKNKTINIQNNVIHFINYSFEELNIKPTLGDYKGGTLISIYNKQKYNTYFNYKCIFLNKQNNYTSSSIKAYIVDDNILTCITEPHNIGDYYFSILIDDLICSFPSHIFNFTFYGQIRVKNIHPLIIPKYNQSIIHIETENVIFNDDLVFKIGKNIFILVKNNQIQKEDENGNKFVFKIPKNLDVGNYSFSISNNNQNFYNSNYYIQIIDFDIIDIKLSHYYIPFNTRNIMYVFGNNFDKYNKDNLAVQFGNYQIQNVTYINNTCLSFEYPYYIQNTGDEKMIKLILTFYFDDLSIKHYPEVILYKNERDFVISPLYFHSYDLNKIILVKSLNNDKDELNASSCSFNNSYKENAIYIEDNLFFCHLPNLAIGTYEISFSINAF